MRAHTKKTNQSGHYTADGCQPVGRCWRRGLGTAAMALLLGACSAADTMPAMLHVGSIPQPEAWKPAVSMVETEPGGSAQPVLVPLRKTVRPSAKVPRLLTKGGGYHKVGMPYTIRGVRYVPRHDPTYNETGIASWYGDNFHGKKTANGELYDMHALTAAHRTMPLPSLATVTNVRTGKTVMVRVNDRGPFRKGRIIDVSAQVAKVLDFADHGLAQVRVKYVGPAPLNGDDSREKAHLAAMRSP